MSGYGWGYVGPGTIPLLEAVAEGRVTRGGSLSFWAPYLLDGQPVGNSDIRSLARKDLIHAPMSGPPRITADGAHVLRDWDEQAWREWRATRWR
jgi:hypothetical protein